MITRSPSCVTSVKISNTVREQHTVAHGEQRSSAFKLDKREDRSENARRVNHLQQNRRCLNPFSVTEVIL